jgi:hypothetical protein
MEIHLLTHSRFKPPLPEEKRLAIRRLGYGILNKVQRISSKYRSRNLETTKYELRQSSKRRHSSKLLP